MSKHTPGPWRVDGNLRSVDGKCFTGEYKTICSPVRGGNPEEADSNARLISAAPEMYEALKLVYDCTFLDSRCTEHQWITASDAVEAAIAKAEGRDA